MAIRPTIDSTPREKIERQVAEFLAKGGTITVLPTTPNAFPAEVKDDKPAPQRASFSFRSIDSNRMG